MDEIDVSNSQLVGMRGDIVVVAMPQPVMTKTEALRHAAWLVALADNDERPKFPAILEAVNQT